MLNRWYNIHPVTRTAFFLLGSLFVGVFGVALVEIVRDLRSESFEGWFSILRFLLSLSLGILGSAAYVVAIKGVIPTSWVSGDWVKASAGGFSFRSTGLFLFYLHLAFAALFFSVEGDTNLGFVLCFLCYLRTGPKSDELTPEVFRDLDAIYSTLRWVSSTGAFSLVFCFVFLKQPSLTLAVFIALPIFVLTSFLRWTLGAVSVVNMEKRESETSKEQNEDSQNHEMQGTPQPS